MASKFTDLTLWYFNLSRKKRYIIWGLAIVVSAIPLLGWFLIAPWLIPLAIFLEYHRP